MKCGASPCLAVIELFTHRGRGGGGGERAGTDFQLHYMDAEIQFGTIFATKLLHDAYLKNKQTKETPASDLVKNGWLSSAPPRPCLPFLRVTRNQVGERVGELLYLSP